MRRIRVRDWERWLEFATEPVILQRPPMIAMVVFSVVTHLLLSPDLGTAGLLPRALLAACSVVPLFPLLWVVHRAGLSGSVDKVMVLVTYIVGGAVRGLLLNWGISALGLAQDASPGMRLLGSAAIIGPTTAYVCYSWAAIVHARAGMSQLQAQSQSLRQAWDELQATSEARDVAQTERLGHSIVQQLLEIADAQRSGQAAQLEALVERVVKPLSRDLSKEIRSWKPQTVNVDVSIRSIWASLDPLEQMPQPMSVALIQLVVSTSGLVAFYGWRQTVLLQIAVIPVLLLSMQVWFSLAKRGSHSLSSPRRELLVTAQLLVAAMFPTATMVWVLRGSEHQFAFFASALFAVPTYAWIMIVATASRQRFQRVSSQLVETRDSLRWSIARINLLNWYRQGVVSRLMHGPVQNSIQAGLLRIRSANDESDTPAILNEVIEHIQQAVSDALHVESNPELEWEAATASIRTWRGIADVELSISDELRTALRTDAPATAILIDLVQEACSNSIRHAGARRLRITCDLQHDLGVITVSDDGGPDVSAGATSGLGTRLLDACAVWLQRERIEGRNLLTVALPIGPKPPDLVPAVPLGQSQR